MDTITRDFISDNFIATELQTNTTFTKSDLIDKINLWKYILRYKCKAKATESIVIGNQILDINYLAIVYAAAELSLKIVIIDYIRSDKFKNLNFVDPKTRVLSPIDIFLHDFPTEFLEKYANDFAKFNFFTKCSHRTYSIKEDIDFSINEEDFKEAINIFPQPDDIIIRSTSSGTTSTPKVIEHTHKFIHAVSQRNAKMYKGTAVHVKNLNHGASAAVTLFPVISNDSVKQHLIYAVDEDAPLTDFVKSMLPYREDAEFIFFPYPYLVDKFIEASKEANTTWPNLSLVTLSYMLESAKIAVRDELFKGVISIFGSTETIGPVVINIIDKTTWNKDPRYFNKVDDFYGIKLYENGKIGITPPVYNRETITNDYFKLEGEYYIHQGRSDLVRINGETIDVGTINTLNREHPKTYIVIDTLNHCLYLACWEDTLDEEINAVRQKIKLNFKRVKITKISKLEKQNFYYGIKIDNELLREYFRNHID
jgi:hypothetical protein